MEVSVICVIRVSRQYAGEESQKAPKFSACAESEINPLAPAGISQRSYFTRRRRISLAKQISKIL